MNTNILRPHEIQTLIDKLEQQALKLETEAVAKKHINHHASQTEALVASQAAAVTRHQIQELAALLHQ
jgi:hypothetical protein